MTQDQSLLAKLATALEGSAHPFALENARLAALSQEVASTDAPVPRHELAPGVWLDFKPDAGVETSVTAHGEHNDGLRLTLDTIGTSPWYTLSYALNVGALSEGRHFGQLLSCSGTGSMRVRSCLRYLLPEGFRDVFSRNLVVLTKGQVEELMFIPIDADLAAKANGAEALLFFEAHSFDITLHSVEALLV
jgi:hypothetical protein